MINIYSEKEIAKIREASRIVAKAHEEKFKSWYDNERYR